MKIPKMQFIRAIAITALSSPVFTWAIFKTEVRQSDVGCLTTNSSPAIEDVKACIDQLSGRGGDCPHDGTGKLSHASSHPPWESDRTNVPLASNIY